MNNNTSPPNTSTNTNTKIETVNNNNNKNRKLIVGVSASRETYLVNYIVLRKQEPIFITTKSLNQYPNIKTQTSDEIQPLNDCENSTIVLDGMLLSNQESSIDLFFIKGRQSNIDFYYKTQSYFHLPKNTIRNNCNVVVFLNKL